MEGAGVGVRVEVEGYRRWWWWCQGEAAGCCLVRVTARTREMVETGLISSPRPGLLGTSDHTSPLHQHCPGTSLGSTHPYLHVLALLLLSPFNKKLSRFVLPSSNCHEEHNTILVYSCPVFPCFPAAAHYLSPVNHPTYFPLQITTKRRPGRGWQGISSSELVRSCSMITV